MNIADEGAVAQRILPTKLMYQLKHSSYSLPMLSLFLERDIHDDVPSNTPTETRYSAFTLPTLYSFPSVGCRAVSARR
jgi:hypothetical protein